MTIALVFAFWFVWFAIGRLGLPNLSGESSDLTLDWLIVHAAVDGGDPYLPIDELARLYDVELGDVGQTELGDAERVHPRPPGAILLLLPLLLVPPEAIHDFSLIFNMIAAVALLGSIAVATSIRAEWVLLAAPLLILSHPAISALEFGSQSFVVAALVTLAVGDLGRTDSIRGGLALGLAIALKLWPGLLLIFLVRRRLRRGAIAAIAMSGSLTILASIVFRLSPLQVWNGLTSASSTWVGFSGNGSLVGRFSLLGLPLQAALALAVLVLFGVVLLVWDRRVDLDTALWGTVVIALLASPLSWDHYDLVLIPGAIVLAGHSHGWFEPTRWALAMWAVLTLGGRFVLLVIEKQSEVAGALAISERALILVALVAVIRSGLRESGAQQPSAMNPAIIGELAP